MAIMYPTTLLAADVKSEAEKKTFASLRDGLSDDWEVFHSAGMIVRGAEGASDDECDFVLCHPRQGIISLEVKGGGIECNHGEWFRINRTRGKERTADPFQQAADHAWSLRRKIDEADGWRGKDLFLVHALWFPDITVHELVLAPDAPPAIVLDRNDVADPAPAIERVFAFHRGVREKRKAPGAAGAEMLRDLLAPQITIEVPLATAFAEEEGQLVELTREQSAILEKFGAVQRAAVIGCAGSGKTMLAVERGKRLATQGRDVLLVCFNKALAKHLRETEPVERLHVFHFHALCMAWAKRAGVDVPAYEGEAPAKFFEEELPDALVEAMAAVGPQYDDLLVDEAQDLHASWLPALMFTLRDEKAASIWLYLDDNQRVYDGDLEVPDGYVPFALDVNCRNTQAIHRQVVQLYHGEVVPDVRGPEGRDVELIHADDQAGTVAALLSRFCEGEEIRPRDVVVLSGHGRENSEVFKELPGTIKLSDVRGKRGVYFSSIRGFKGLESPLVILCELENLDDATRDSQLYVGMSRARNHCVIVAPPAA